MKRTLSVILTLAMLISMCSVCFVNTAIAAEAEKTVIRNTSPAITADVGENIDLSTYSVMFDGDTYATEDIVWKDASGTVITEYFPSKREVATITATSGTKSKTIYVVSKNAADTEYVLYEADLANFSTITEIKNAGWTLPEINGASYAKGTDGSLQITQSITTGVSAVYLPEWLGNFGDYKFEANVKIVECQNTARWFALMYRSDNRDVTSHYVHMCVRDNNSGVENGIEHAEKRLNDEGTGDAWNVMYKTTGIYSTMTDAYRTASVQAYGGNVAYTLGGTQVLYVPESAYTSAIKLYNKVGYLGIEMSGGTLAVKSVKVTIQEEIPEEFPRDTTLIYNGNHDADNLINPIANAQRVAPATTGGTITASQLEGLTVAFFNADGNVAANIKTCVNAGVVPTVFITSNAQADAVVAGAKAAGKVDINVMSGNVDVLKYIRNLDSRVRTGLRKDISSYLNDGVLTDVEADEIRKIVRSTPATFVVIDAEDATKQAVAELQEMALAVWAVVDATDGNGNAVSQETQDLEVMKVLTSGANGVITSDALNVNALIKEKFVENSMTRTPIIIGHRGNPEVAPENTIESFQAAYDNGADVFELDVELTKDNVVVVLHDGTLTRTTTYTGSTSISNMTWAEAQKYHVLALDGKTSTGKPIPTLQEVLVWAKGKDIKIFVEFKSANAANCITPTMNLIASMGMTQQVDVISFSASACASTQTALKGMSTGLLMGNSAYAYTYGSALVQLDSLLETAQVQKSTVNPGSYSRQISNHSVQAMADRGMTIWPWTYSETNTGAAFIDCPDGITTDNTELIKNMAKFIEGDDFSMFAGQTYSGGTVTVETYGNAVSTIDVNNLIPVVVSGDSVKVENGKLVAVSEGTASVIFGYKTQTYSGEEYVLYTQPVTVTVDNDDINILKPLMDIAETVIITDMAEADAAALREVYAKAEILVNSAAPSATEIQETAVEFANVVAKIINPKYTTTKPNYLKYQTTMVNPIYADDGLRLMDGIKSTEKGNNSNYSAWQMTSDGKVNIIVDNSTPAERDTFCAYFAADEWGINEPADMSIFYSDDGENWTEVNSNDVVYTIADHSADAGLWSLYKFMVTSGSVINARYYKFVITFDGSFVWMDEIELYNSKLDVAYVNGVNTMINSGDCHIFTSALGTLNGTNANFEHTTNVIAKWDEEAQAYIVTSKQFGSTAKTITLASDEIMISAHDWETNTGGDTPVVGSALNSAVVASAEVGQKVEFYGIDTTTWELGIAPGIKFSDIEHVHSYSTSWSYDDAQHWHECKCGDKSYVAPHAAAGDWESDANNHWHMCECGAVLDKNGHNMGDWVVTVPATTETEGEKVKSCTECGKVLVTEAIPVLEPDHTHEGIGGWMNDETDHWHVCSCGEKLDIAAHAGEWKVLAEAQIGKAGLKEMRCTACGYLIDSETIPALEAPKDEEPKDEEPKDEPEDKFILGDVNNSGAIDMLDYILLKRAYFGTYTLDEDGIKRGDCNKNGGIDMTDYILLKRAYFGTYVLV